MVATGHANRNLIATGDGDDSIEALGGDDVLFAGGGADAVDAGEGDDVLIIIGRNVPGEASYRLYTTSDLTSPRGSGLDVSGVVNLNSLQNHAEDDAPGDNFAGGAGADTLIVFGTTDLSRAVLSGIETIIIASDVTITPDQLVGITEIIAGDGSILRLTGEGMADLSTVAITSLPHLEVAAGITVNVAAASSLAGIEVLSGTGLVQVQMDDATAFAGIQLAQGLRVAVNAASEDAMRVQTVGDTATVAVGDTANFGGAALLPANVLPSGGLRIEGTASAEQLTGTGNADQITVGTGDTATGGGGADIFNLPATGSAVITDFAVDDRLRLSDLGPEQVASAVVGSGGQLTITLTDGTTRSFTLQGVSARNLEIADATVGAAAAVDLVFNVPKPPSGVALSGAVAPRGEAGWVIGRLSATDPDGGANPVLTWSLSDTSNFEVVNDFLKLKPGVSLNADRPVTVTVTDAQGLTAQQAFSIKPLPEMLGMDSISTRDIGAAALTATGSAGQVLRGRMGSDELVGSVGADIIDGGLHDDVLTGDDGGDVFIYRFDSSGESLAGIDGDDIILDFNVAEGDKILWIDESTESGRISSLQAFKDAYGTYEVAAESVPDGAPEGSNAFLIQFDTTASPNPLNSISGTFALTVVFEEGVSADLFESGRFNDVDAFIEAFGGPDGFLFA